MKITKDTIMCASFAKEAGNFGALVHNTAARYHYLSFVYKPFSVDSIADAIKAMRLLKFRGAGITMPFKTEVLQYIDEQTPEVSEIGSANTILNEGGKLIAYNTDWVAASKMLKDKMTKELSLVILGRGGYAKAVGYAAKKLGYKPTFINRTDALWQVLGLLKNKLIYNCTPAKVQINDNSNVLIDSSIDTETGKQLALWQAGEQFVLYTGKSFPIDWITSNSSGIIL